MPEYDVWCPERGQTEDDARTIQAILPRVAACRWAERDDAESGDYSIVGGNPVDLCVRQSGSPTVERFCVNGEAVPEYFAVRVDVPPQQGETR